MSTPRRHTDSPADSAIKSSPEQGDNPGYAEDEPRDREAAHGPHGRDVPPSPDEGGLERDTDPDGGVA